MSKPVRVIINLNSVVVRGNNIRTTIFKREPEDIKPQEAKHIIQLLSLTAETTEKPGVEHFLTENGKIKASSIGLSDKGLIHLYKALHEYLVNVKP